MMQTDSTTLTIQVPFSYPVVFTRNLFAPDNACLSRFFADRCEADRPVRLLCFVDDGVWHAWPDLGERVQAWARRCRDSVDLVHEPVPMEGGEAAKNSYGVVQKAIRLSRRCRLCRHSAIVAIGGGAFLDAVGFAAAMIHRGLPLVRVPTTVLSQNDSGVGVKNGINVAGSKNFLGIFAPPAAVFNDAAFLRTLSRRDRVAGLAEAFKVGAIEDRVFLEWLMARGAALVDDDALLEAAIRRCAMLHLHHIESSGDPFEFGSARPLDFGHWAAHKLESLTLHELRHGEAVAIGITIDLLYAAAMRFVSGSAAEAVIGAMAATGLPVWHEALELREPSGRRMVLQGIEEFREHLGGELHVTLPSGLGRRAEVTHLREEVLERCVQALGARVRKEALAYASQAR